MKDSHKAFSIDCDACNTALNDLNVDFYPQWLGDGKLFEVIKIHEKFYIVLLTITEKQVSVMVELI